MKHVDISFRNYSLYVYLFTTNRHRNFVRVSYHSTDLDLEEPQLQGILRSVSAQCIWYIGRKHTRSNKYNFIIKKNLLLFQCQHSWVEKVV